MLSYKNYYNNSIIIPPRIVCTNCGIEGHVYKMCTSPVTSYGVIAVRNLSTYINSSIFCSKADTITGTDTTLPLEFLLRFIIIC